MKKLVLILVVCLSLTAHADTLTREDVESAFLYHFINYTVWDDQLPDFYVCIPEDDALRQSAVTSFKGKVVNSRNLVVVDRWQSCHILVADNLPESDNMLTVGRLDRGAMFEFRLVDNKIKFAANLKKVKESKVKISSQLLKLAILENDK